MADKILSSFDVWIGAQGWKSKLRLKNIDNISLDGIDRLRELIFELALKGTLVKTTTNEKPILKTIGEIADLVMGQAPPGDTCNKDGIGTIFVKTGEFGRLFPEVVEWTTKPLKLAKKGDVLICVVGATVGKINLGIDCAIGRSVAAIRPSELIVTKYLYYCLMPFTIKLRNQSRGSAQGVIGKNELNAVEIRLPSISEQHLIIAKVDELMALCDELEEKETNHLKSHQILVKALLGTLTQAKDAAEFQTAWATLAQHFDDLFITEDSIDQLKQTILQLAVMGKLVKQDPKDEPASVLLERGVKKKQGLKNEVKNKRQKELEEISEEEKKVVLPNGWVWVKLGNIGKTNIGLTYSPKDISEKGIPVLRSSNIQVGQIDLTDLVRVSTKAAEKNFVESGDLLICARNGSRKLVGKCALIPLLKERMTFGAFMAIFRSDYNIYIKHFLESPYFRSRLDGVSTTTINQITQENLKNTIVPFPPLKEQLRIVAKVDELFGLCDLLKERITETQKVVNLMANSILEQVD